MTLPKINILQSFVGALLASNISVVSSSSFDTLAARQEAKPFYLKDIQIGDTTLPFSPVSVVIAILSIIMLLKNLFGGPKSSAVASHILVDDTEEAKARLNAMKKEINDFTKFQGAAQRNSKCPSGKASGGSLGRFSPGMMVPAFDKVIFDKESKVGQVIGPIRTNFGYHLIWIEERNLVE